MRNSNKLSKKHLEVEYSLDIQTKEKKRINWFPGHMNKAIREIKERLKLVDIVFEIRDARSPLVTSNEALTKEMGEKNRLIIFNKVNLADPEVTALWEIWLKKENVPFIFSNCFEKDSLKKIIKQAREVIHKKRLLSNPDAVMRDKMKAMIVGLPNTGKSTIINKFANRNASKVADRPGQTQHQLWVNVDKNLKILDTPGIMPPKIEEYEHGVWLAALNAISERIVEVETPACYIVEYLLQKESQIFKDYYKLETLDASLVETIESIGKNRGFIRQKSSCDYERVYRTVLRDFRKGNLGLISFELPPD